MHWYQRDYWNQIGTVTAARNTLFLLIAHLVDVEEDRIDMTGAPPKPPELKVCTDVKPPPLSSSSNPPPPKPPKPMPKPGSPKPKPPKAANGDIAVDIGKWPLRRLLWRITRLVPPPKPFCRFRAIPPPPIMPKPPKGSIKSSKGSAPPKNSRKMSNGSLKANEEKPKFPKSSSSSSNVPKCWCPWWWRWAECPPLLAPLPPLAVRPSRPYLSKIFRFLSSDSTSYASEISLNLLNNNRRNMFTKFHFAIGVDVRKNC